MSMNSLGSMLVYLGANANKELVHRFRELNPGIRLVSSALFPEVPASLLGSREYAEMDIPFDAALRQESGEIGFTPVNDHNLLSLIEEVMDDKQLSLLWTRFTGKTRRSNQSEVKRYEVVYSLIKCALETCLSLRPAVVVFSYEPHMLPMYVFKKVVVALGIETHTLTISPFIWRMSCVDAAGACSLQRQDDGAVHEGVASDDSVQKLIDEKQGHYREAKPFYEKRNSGRGLLGGLYNKLKVNGGSPRRTLGCRLALAEYQEHASARSGLQGQKYICVFLQYQPEQTTLPEGGLFVHQMFAIQMLYSAVSSLGISLVIREHPATFEAAFDPKWRPKGYYRSIRNIGPGIYFDEIQADPFSLIENSIGVASITGTVLLEALLRGKPAIAFGKHTLQGYASPAFVDRFANEVDLRERIVQATAALPQSIAEDVAKYLHKIYPQTFGGGDYPGNSGMSLQKLRQARYDALLQVVEQLVGQDNCATRTVAAEPASDLKKA